MSEQVLYDHYARRSLHGLDSATVAAIRQWEQAHGRDRDYGAVHYFRSAEYQARLNEQKDFSVYNTEGLSDFAIILNKSYYLGDSGDAIAQKAQEICAGLTTDREKARAISQWICSHIYYDHTNYEGSNASEAFNSRHGVCHSYACLTMAMCHAVGIPCTYETSATHAWNAIFWDGKWHLVDNTWVSSLEYRNGKFLNGDKAVANYLEPGAVQRDEDYYDGAEMDFYDDGDHRIKRRPMSQFSQSSPG